MNKRPFYLIRGDYNYDGDQGGYVLGIFRKKKEAMKRFIYHYNTVNVDYLEEDNEDHIERSFNLDGGESEIVNGYGSFYSDSTNSSTYVYLETITLDSFRAVSMENRFKEHREANSPLFDRPE